MRALIVTVLALGLAIPALIYLLLTLPPVQSIIRDTAERELSTLLGVNVRIGDINIAPFNRASLNQVLIYTGETDTIAAIDHIGAGISLRQLLDDKIVITYAEIAGLDGRISRPTTDGPLNIQPIIDALSPKDKTKPPTEFDFKANTVILRKVSLRYDILDKPQPAPGRFDPAHVAITNLRADITLPRIANDDFSFDIMQLAFAERSGLRVMSLSGNYYVTATGITAIKPVVKINDSELYLSDITLRYNSWTTMADDIKNSTLDLAILDGTHIVPADFSPLIPALADITSPLNLVARLNGRLDDINIDAFQASMPAENILIDLRGNVASVTRPADISVEMPLIDLRFNGNRATEVARRFTTLPPRVANILTRAGNVEIKGGGSYSRNASKFDGTISTDAGNAIVDATYSAPSASAKSVTGNIKVDNFNIGSMLELDDMGVVTMDAKIDARFDTKLQAARFDGTVSRFDYKGYSYTGIAANVDYDGKRCSGTASINDPGMDIDLDGTVTFDGEIPQVEASLRAAHVNLGLIPGVKNAQGNIVSVAANASLSGRDIDRSVGRLSVDYITLTTPKGKTIKLDDINVETDNLSSPQYFDITSPLIDGHIEGKYAISKLPVDVRHILADVFPTLLNHSKHSHDEINPAEDFTFNLLLKPTHKLDSIIKLPANIVDNIEIDGHMHGPTGAMALNIHAPYIIKDKMLMRNTVLNATVDGNDRRSNLYFTTTAVNKKDNITLILNADGFNDRIDSRLAWNYNRPRRYDGEMNFTTSFEKADSGKLVTRIDVNPSTFAVNDTTWRVSPATIKIAPGPAISVDDLKIGRDDQFVTIDGNVSKSERDRLLLELENVNLDYIFETLAIDNVMFGGNATGEFTASSLLSGAPRLATDGLDVKGLSYNHAVLGDAILKSSWDNDHKAVAIYADISQANGRKSYVDGRIMPMADSLDIKFDADRLNVGFLQPFMSAFATEVSGLASGKARLYGTFKLVDMTGDIFAEDFKLKLGFTNCTYTCTDSIHLRPGSIDLKNIEITDAYGNHGMLSGYLRHDFFKRPRFEFNVTDAKNLLVYDVNGTPKDDTWYGRVFGDGSARVSGEPGKVDIGVNMTTAPKSTFTFVLTNNEVAADYNFITFRDRDAALKVTEVEAEENLDPTAVREWYKQLHQQAEANYTSIYNMDINVNVTPQAEITLVMDPVGGDKIRAFGEGNLRLTYSSGSEDLRMYGDYTLERGNYNFTLQDIIIKEFNIQQGSAIRFNGDPYSAMLDIKAEYTVNANLSDLDESFLTDKDLNRTNVPVHAMLLVTGDMRQPDINFDLAFPTLNSDIDRKVRSIISTDDMMSRQIVYLLTLSRFYTPEYMSTTKGNELVSMASSTITSQISNMLGGISDKWNIAPALRSDRGDFSDVEFDVALSSTLLNNRLLLNGNFGYRDKALNNNSFIGDFDIEYLLNRSGTLRLKAYNRYNDQNYYLKSALTTQGVGVMWRKDFDSFTSFLKPLLKKKSAAPADTIHPADTIPSRR